MVEPVPEVFAALRRHRGNDARFDLVQAVVTDHDGMAEMSVVDPERGDAFDTTLLSSVQPEVILRHDIAPERLHTIRVPAVTLPTLLERVERVDLLQLDTEGHDAAILAQLDLDTYRPAVILYESKHLSSTDREECEARLRAAGYTLVSDSEDTIARQRR